MKLHKSIRQYAKFDQNKLNELIEINSYNVVELKEFDSHFKSKLKELTEQYYYNSKIIDLFKHKTNNSYMLHIRDNPSYKLYLDVYLYFIDEPDSFNLHRIKKPSEILLSNSNNIELNYYKNGVLHNEYGPSHITYELKNNSFTLIYIGFRKNGEFYNKNGLVAYALLTSDSLGLTFMRNNIVKHFNYNGSNQFIEITDLNNDTEVGIVKAKNYTSYKYKSKKMYHKLNGPAVTFIQNGVISKQWWINNNLIPDDIFQYEEGLEKNITKSDVLKATLFDREYGEFLNGLFCAQSS